MQRFISRTAAAYPHALHVVVLGLVAAAEERSTSAAGLTPLVDAAGSRYYYS